MRENILHVIHEGHQGVNSCIRLAKTSVYWPNMNTDIEKFILGCPICLTYRRNNTKEPMVKHDYTLLPWSKVGVDIF